MFRGPGRASDRGLFAPPPLRPAVPRAAGFLPRTAVAGEAPLARGRPNL